ncbi:MAG: hypothetical protein AB7P99_07160 [Vicinamibacterales bacterium]
MAAAETSPATELRDTLEGLADALAHGRLELLLQLDTRLDRALVSLRTLQLEPDTMPQVRADLVAARAALARCRHLGDGLTAFVCDALTARGTGVGYQPDLRRAAPTGAAIDARA